MKIALLLISLILIAFSIKPSKADVEITKETYITNLDGHISTNYEVVFIKDPIIASTNTP